MPSGISETDIYNRALAKLGSTRISSTTQNIERAKVLNDMYTNVRDSLLRENPWNFAVKRATIGVNATAPDWGWDNRYVLPTDFLLLLEIEDYPPYNIESGYILTNTDTTIKIKYVSRDPSTAQYDSLFVEALACKLAYEACESITKSARKKEELWAAYEQAMQKGKFRDGFEQDPDERIEDEWVDARR